MTRVDPGEAWACHWPPRVDVRSLSKADARSYAVEAEHRIHSLAGRGVVEEATRFVGRLADAGLLDGEPWRKRLVRAAVEAGHPGAQHRVDVGWSSVRWQSRGAGRSGAASGPSPSALPNPASLLRARRDGRLTDADIHAMIEAKLQVIRETRQEPDPLVAIRRTVAAEWDAAALTGSLYALGIVGLWPINEIAAVRRAGPPHLRHGSDESIDRAMCRGMAHAWPAVWNGPTAARTKQHLLKHGYQFGDEVADRRSQQKHMLRRTGGSPKVR